MRQKLLTIRGIPTYFPWPSTYAQAKTLPNWPRWQMAMSKFMDQTIGGLLPVAPSVTRGKPISRVSWIYDYRVDANG